MAYVVGRKPEHEILFFPCKVAGGDDERYLVSAAVAAAVVPDAIDFPMCLARIFIPVCVVLCVSLSCACRSHWNGCMNVAWAMLWGGSQSTKPRVFPCKVPAGDDERYLVCAAVAAAVVPDAIGFSYGFFKNLCSCVRNFSMRFLKLCLQIALEWLHECCMVHVVGRKPEHETLCFSV